MREILKDTAINALVFMADETDHQTGVEELTLSVTVSKDGAAFASISPAVTELGSGWYSVALTAGDTDVEGELLLRCTATGADPGERLLVVYEAKAANVVLWDGAGVNGGTATLAFKSVTITNDSGTGLSITGSASAVDLQSTDAESNNPAVNLQGVSGPALRLLSVGDSLLKLGDTEPENQSNRGIEINSRYEALQANSDLGPAINVWSAKGSALLIQNGDEDSSGAPVVKILAESTGGGTQAAAVEIVGLNSGVTVSAPTAPLALDGGSGSSDLGETLAALQVAGDKINAMVESDGGSGFRYTTPALQNAPTGGRRASLIGG